MVGEEIGLRSMTGYERVSSGFKYSAPGDFVEGLRVECSHDATPQQKWKAQDVMSLADCCDYRIGKSPPSFTVELSALCTIAKQSTKCIRS